MASNFSLPGIKTIHYVPCSQIPKSVLLCALAKQPIVITSDMVPVPFAGDPTCEGERANNNNGVSESITFSFSSLVVIPEDEPLAFVVTDLHNKMFLIGTREEPYPLITCRQSFGSPSGDPHVLAVEVAFTAPKALLPCTKG